ncbi:MAG: NAD-glutamate dehydrogenase [Acidimicrobiales bacterium]|nr:NAD-glutamate dehydrogenase [Acidimicrobiales bacterium]
MESILDQIVEHAAATLPRGVDLEGPLRAYFAHVSEEDLATRRVPDLFGLAADHLQLADAWQTGMISIEVANPRIEVDGWECDQTVVRIVTDDMPFLVDSVAMELSRLGIGIHFVTHPVMYRRSDSTYGHVDECPDGKDLVSLMSIEIDRQATEEDRESIAENLRRVLIDVRSSVNDWLKMRARMQSISAQLETADLPVEDVEVAEARELLDWLAADHFIFLGARNYAITIENEVEVLSIIPGSGLGILSGESHLGHGRPLSDLPPAARERVKERRLLNLTKASSRSTVHRASFLDYVGIKTFDSNGDVTGEQRFLGLFTSEVYNRSVERMPRARRTVAEVVARAAFPPGGHDEKRLKTILETYPRDDLIQMDADELFEIAIAIAGLQERRKVRLFSRRELFGRFVTVLVYLPRDRYNTSIRTGIEDILLDAYGGSLADWDAQLSESVLARLRFFIQVDQYRVPPPDPELEARVDHLTHLWVDDLSEAIVHDFGDTESLRLEHTYRDAFGPDYQRAFDPRTASADIQEIEQLGDGGSPGIAAYREPGHAQSAFKLKLYRRGERVSLTAVMPSLTNLGVTVLDERPYEIRPADHESVWIYDFSLEHHATTLDFSKASDLVEEAFTAVWSGAVEDDGFNRLVLCAGMPVANVSVLRAYARYLRQIGLSYSRLFVEHTLEAHPDVANLLWDLFAARLDPEAYDPDAAPAILSRLNEQITAVESLDQDRILRRFRNLIMATVRTTWAQRDADGNPLPYIAFKLDPTALAELPNPRPKHEIFVYSPRFEGVHLRGGPVARGGLRWSDRTEDYRTEVLGLVKAQMVKNSVIVPSGAKGGFVLKQRPDDPAAVREEVVACYKLFVSALLDLTDNLVDGVAVPPPQTVRHDGDDTYLVVAADKGTATFSDIANELSMGRGFWLGDAFASGGSNGYDHKAMGITARGAWESVKRHFRELGTDVQSEPFTAVGIGDMSGDVFGNGMLLSPFTMLVAAFDHRHIFLDPDPDPSISYAERQRLFNLPRSSWADYNPDLISVGGGVYERSAKSITVSPEVVEVLQTDTDEFTPEELMSAILRAPVQLFWNGGIGTYVKASNESHAEVGDKANDHLRVDGRDLRCLVIGEGGNLGVTQRGRVEFARTGGRIFTDAIDNAGGVNCSDHEVNIKILLDRVVANGDMTPKQRNLLLGEMTDEVAQLVLRSNYEQALALSSARVDAVSLLDVHARYIGQLEQRGLIDRRIEALPDAEELADRRLAGTGLTVPELSVLNAYSKNILKSDLLASSIPDDPALSILLHEYFPSQLRSRFVDQIEAHQLRREIVATVLSNMVIDRAGVSMIYRLGIETSAPAPEIAAAHFAAWQIFQLEDVVSAVNALDGVLPIDRQLKAHLSCQQLAERAARLLTRNRPNPFSVADAFADLAEPVAEAVAGLDEYLLGTERAAFESDVAQLTASGAGVDLARRLAGLSPSLAALDIVEVAASTGAPVRDVMATHFAVADRLELTWLRDRILALPRDSQWSTLARLTLRLDLYADHRQLTSQVMALGNGDGDAKARVDAWMRRHRLAVDRFRRTMVEIRTTTSDLTVLLVAAREVRNLIARTLPKPDGLDNGASYS